MTRLPIPPFTNGIFFTIVGGIFIIIGFSNGDGFTFFGFLLIILGLGLLAVHYINERNDSNNSSN